MLGRNKFRQRFDSGTFPRHKSKNPRACIGPGVRLGCSAEPATREVDGTLGTFYLEIAHLATNLTDCLLLQLANALARQVVLIADFFEGELVLVVEAETPANDARFDGRQGVEQTLDLLSPLLV